MRERHRKWIVFALLLITAFSFRFCVARYLPNDSPEDGKGYARMARNLLEHHVFSDDSEPPYAPSLIRLPGYSLFLASIYSVFGHFNNTAVRFAQAVLDSLTCGLVGLIAYYWEPDERRKRRAAIAAFALAAVCPFTAIYVATVLTEAWAIFLAIGLCLATTFAFRARTFKQSLWRWSAAGLVGGLAVFVRPDSGLFVAAVGLTLVASGVLRQDSGSETKSAARTWRTRVPRVLAQGAVLSIAFALVLVPWTVRNWRTFHVFQPLSPAHAEMPGEFVPRGYLTWVRSWIDDRKYIETMLWSLDDAQIDVDDLPARAFDSAAEKVRVTELLEQYNNPAQPDEPDQTSDPTDEPEPTPSPTPAANSPAGKKTASPVSKKLPAPEANAGNADDQKDQEDESDKGAQEPAEEQKPEMTPAIDAAFGQIARERIARAPLRYYVWLPMKRVWSLCVGPHADYYPFAGELFPLADLDHNLHQQIWLPLFAGLVGLYGLLGVAGGWCLWRARSFIARRWLLLTVLVIFLRLAFFSSMENPEPRYTVELFPFLAVLGGIAISHLNKVRQPR